jgi:hypothetical protein
VPQRPRGRVAQSLRHAVCSCRGAAWRGAAWAHVQMVQDVGGHVRARKALDAIAQPQNENAHISARPHVKRNDAGTQSRVVA